MSKVPNSLKTGELLVLEGYVKASDVETALEIQRRKAKDTVSGGGSRLVGRILCELNLITPFDLYNVLTKYGKQKSLEDILLGSGQISREEMEKARLEARDSKMPIADVLYCNRFVALEDLQAAMFEQLCISYKILDNFYYTQLQKSKLKRILDKTYASGHLILPLSIKDKTIVVGVAGPENLKYIKSLWSLLSRFRLFCVIIPLFRFRELYCSLYGEALFPEQSALPETVTVKAENEKTETSKGSTPPDLSLLFSFKTVITDPEKEKNSIYSLYGRYETLRKLLGGKDRESDKEAFYFFIREKFRHLCKDYGCLKIEFYLEETGKELCMMARPLETAGGNNV